MTQLFICLVFLLNMLIVNALPAVALDAKQLFKQYAESIVMVMRFDTEDKLLGVGSGFFVEDGKTVVTNSHVISGAFYVKIKTLFGNVYDVVDMAGSPGSQDDLVLLMVSHPGKPLTLATHQADVGEEIAVIGNPLQLEDTISTGIVSGIRKKGETLYYQITASVSPGSSGGPVIDAHGKVIGIATFSLNKGQNLNFAIHSSHVKKLLNSKISVLSGPEVKPPPGLGDTKLLPRRRLP